MKGIKCSSCGLTNFGSELFCRRCGSGIGQFTATRSKKRNPREEAKQSSWLYTILIIVLIAGGAYYLYGGFLKSFEEVQSPVPVQTKTPAPNPQPALTSRTESDKQRTVPFKNAIQNSQGLSEADRRLAETQKLMQPAK